MSAVYFIKYNGQKANVSAFEHEEQLLYRLEWDDYTVDIMKKRADGSWEDITVIDDDHRVKIGNLIDEQVNKKL